MSDAANPDATNSATFLSRRVIPFPPASVYEAFARADLLSQWWGPNGFTNTFDVFEFKPKGNWKFTMHGPDDKHYPQASVFLELKPQSKVVIHHVSQPRFVLTVTLEAQGAGTAITWVQVFEDDAVGKALRPIIEPANEQNLNRLEAILEGQTPA